MAIDIDYVGKQIGNYHIVKKLASGGFGEVYIARHVLLPRTAAIKFLHHDLIASKQKRDAFLQEARLLEDLKHPHILAIYDVSVDREGFPPHLITEYAPGGSLRDHLLQVRGLLPMSEAIAVVEQVGKALQHAHSQQNPIIHRDLKPENVLFNAQDKALLADFGIAVVLSAHETSRIGIAGTLPYMAPEQFDGVVSEKSDQYALGCLAYELITRHKPIKVENGEWLAWAFKHRQEPPLPLSYFNPEVPLAVELAVHKALAKEPEHRHSNVGHFLAALHSISKDSTQYDVIKEMWMHQAQTAYENRHYEQSLALYTRIAAIDAAYTRAVCGIGDTLFALKRYQEALSAYEEAIGQGDWNASALKGKKQTLQAIARLEQEQAIKLIEQRHQIALSRIMEGESLLDLQRYTQALAAFDDALCFDAHDSRASTGRGNALRGLGNNEDALDAYEWALQCNPQNVIACYGKALILEELEHYQQAIAAYDQVIRLHPEFADAYSGKGNVFFATKDFHKALEAYEQAILRNPRHRDACFGRAETLLKLKRRVEALEAYKKAIEIDPHFSGNINDSLRQGDALLLLDRCAEALAIYEQLLKLEPDNADLHERRGSALQKLGRKRDATQAYRKADELREFV